VTAIDCLDHACVLLLVAFALAAYGPHGVLAVRHPSELGAVSRRLGSIVAISMVLFLAVTLIANFARRPMIALAMAYLAGRFEKALAYYSQRLDLLFQLFTPIRLGVLVPLPMASAGLVLVSLIATWRLPPSLFLSLIVGLTAADLLFIGLKYNSFRSKEVLIHASVASGGGWLVMSVAFYPGW